MQQLLMIEDDTRLAQMVGEYLERSGFGVTHAVDARAGLHLLEEPPSGSSPDLVVLDLMLPDIDGLEVCRRVRALPGDSGKVPVLMLTAKGDPMDRIVGLELGADDYLPKPFEPRELLARIRAILRRRTEGMPAPAKVMRFGSLEIDRDARTVAVGGKPAELTSYQFDLLVVLAERAGRVLTRDQIMEAVRGRELEAFDRSIDVHMGAHPRRHRGRREEPGSASSRCAAWVTYSPSSRTEPHGVRMTAWSAGWRFPLYLRIWLAVIVTVGLLTVAFGYLWRMNTEPVPMRDIIIRDQDDQIIGESRVRPQRVPGQGVEFDVKMNDGRTITVQLPPRPRAPGEMPGARPWIPRGPTGFLWLLAMVGFAVAVGSYPIVRRLTLRLEELRGGVERWGDGDLSVRVPERGSDEVAFLAQRFNHAAGAGSKRW